ncbi:DUF2490 domain-containing protein [Parafilimonas sp.]|uniref:DUF2490 domain-containing protein n=1 Tax=Parafilimonas sp. TaxID=1969739 RepID=UPI0039E3B3A3
MINNYQTWVSLNAYMRIGRKWGIMNDLHLRTNHFFATNNFSLVRIGAVYWLSDKISVAAGYTRIWIAPASGNLHQYSDGDWIYQQVQYVSKKKKNSIGIYVRLLNEQRWQQRIINDKKGGIIFSDRVRLLGNFTSPVSKKFYVPAPVLADELHIQFGKDIVYNTFYQNRIFIGIKQNITHSLYFDFGYMQVYQQKANGYQYNHNNTLRLFFYYKPYFRKK